MHLQHQSFFAQLYVKIVIMENMQRTEHVQRLGGGRLYVFRTCQFSLSHLEEGFEGANLLYIKLEDGARLTLVL